MKFELPMSLYVLQIVQDFVWYTKGGPKIYNGRSTWRMQWYIWAVIAWWGTRMSGMMVHADGLVFVIQASNGDLVQNVANIPQNEMVHPPDFVEFWEASCERCVAGRGECEVPEAGTVRILSCPISVLALRKCPLHRMDPFTSSGSSTAFLVHALLCPWFFAAIASLYLTSDMRIEVRLASGEQEAIHWNPWTYGKLVEGGATDRGPPVGQSRGVAPDDVAPGIGRDQGARTKHKKKLTRKLLLWLKLSNWPIDLPTVRTDGLLECTTFSVPKNISTKGCLHTVHHRFRLNSLGISYLNPMTATECNPSQAAKLALGCLLILLHRAVPSQRSGFQQGGVWRHAVSDFRGFSQRYWSRRRWSGATMKKVGALYHGTALVTKLRNIVSNRKSPDVWSHLGRALDSDHNIYSTEKVQLQCLFNSSPPLLLNGCR